MTPQGRLTLQTGKPVMDAGDITASAVYYTPYVGDGLPIWTGAAWTYSSFAEMTLPLTGTVGGKLYDVFATGAGLVLGSAWSNAMQRSVPISRVLGLWADDANRVYLGTLYCHSAGFTKFQLKPPRVAFGTNNILGLWNAYNRIKVTAICQDANESWSYANSGVRFADNSNQFRINWVDGLAESYVKTEYQTSIAGANLAPAAATVGIGFDCNYPISDLAGGSLNQAAVNNNALGMMLEGRNWSMPKPGLHYAQALEQSTPVPLMFYGNDFSALTVELDA